MREKKCPFVNGVCLKKGCIHFKFMEFGANVVCETCGCERVEEVFKTLGNGGVDYESVCMGCGGNKFVKYFLRERKSKMIEIETKFKIENEVDFRGKLESNGFTIKESRYEKDTYFTPSINNSGIIVRLRTFQDNSGIFTVKIPTDADGVEEISCKEEVESDIQDVRLFIRQLNMMGYSVVKSKEKHRETYQKLGVIVTLDKLPYLGFYSEIESPAISTLKRVAMELGLSMDEAISKSYLGLFEEYKEITNQPDLKFEFLRN